MWSGRVRNEGRMYLRKGPFNQFGGGAFNETPARGCSQPVG